MPFTLLVLKIVNFTPLSTNSAMEFMSPLQCLEHLTPEHNINPLLTKEIQNVNDLYFIRLKTQII